MFERMLVLGLLTLPAHADIIRYSDSGTFSGSTPSTTNSRAEPNVGILF